MDIRYSVNQRDFKRYTTYLIRVELIFTVVLKGFVFISFYFFLYLLVLVVFFSYCDIIRY